MTKVWTESYTTSKSLAIHKWHGNAQASSHLTTFFGSGTCTFFKTWKKQSQLSVSTVHRAEKNSRLVKPCNLCPLPMSEHRYRCHYWLPNQFRQHYWTWMCQRHLASRCKYYFILFQYCFSYLAQYFLRRGMNILYIILASPQWRMMYCSSLKKKVVNTTGCPSKDLGSKQQRNVSQVAGPSSCESSEACRTNLDIHVVIQAPKSKLPWVSKWGL